MIVFVFVIPIPTPILTQAQTQTQSLAVIFDGIDLEIFVGDPPPALASSLAWSYLRRQVVLVIVFGILCLCAVFGGTELEYSVGDPPLALAFSSSSP